MKKMNGNIKNKQEQEVRHLLSGTELKAGDKLKCRIMQQIGTEKNLLRRPVRPEYTIRNMISVFAVMYILIAIAGGSVYFSLGKDALWSSAFYMPVLSITFICGIYWMISCLDDKLWSRGKK